MNDINQQNGMPAGENAPRRRRADRNRAAYDAYDEVMDQPISQATLRDEGGDTQVAAPVSPAADTQQVVRTVPSQGVPTPNALRQDAAPHTEHAGMLQAVPAVRRPVPAADYRPVEQLGSGRPSMDAPRRPQRINFVPKENEEEEVPGNGGLIAIILVLLVIAAVVIGLIMIPEDEPGMLGSIKRTVTEPLRGLFAGNDAEHAEAAHASDFTATVVQDTVPYRVSFSVITSNDVTSVRVVDANGNPLQTEIKLSQAGTERTTIWQMESTLQTGYKGLVEAQMQHGGSWIATGLMQELSIGMNTPPTISSVPASITASVQPAATTAAPAKITQAPVTQAPVVQATETPAPTPEYTATPTMSVTATPTMMPTEEPTATPTVDATEEPTATPEATEEPTEAAPTEKPTPIPTPRLEAAAAESADPALITSSTIWNGSKKTENYNRAKPINMPAGSDYLTRDFGVTTFRQNAFRQNAASGFVNGPSAMSVLWKADAGVARGESRNYYGVGWTGQPLINKWNKDVRQILNISDELKAEVLKEVIVAGYDGKIYFLNLEDGTPTRDPIDLGYPMRGTPTLSPIGYPMMTVGQYARKLKSGMGKNIGLYYYDLTKQKQVRLIDGLDRDRERTGEAAGAFDTSALIDRNTNTLIVIGTNGMLYTEELSMKLRAATEDTPAKYEFSDPTQVSIRSKAKGQDNGDMAVESSLAMYGSYAYWADMDGVLRCVDTTTMTTAWAVDTGESVRAAIALDLDDTTHTLWLYTANTVGNNRTRGDVSIRRFNAMTGEEDWAFAVHCAEGKKKDVTFGKVITPGAIASPVIGQHDLAELVYFTLSSVSKTGAASLAGEGAAAMEGVLIALSKETGEVVWHKEMDAYCYASPVAVYTEEGRGWIIQACSNGTLHLLDGLTGETVNTLQIEGVIEGSPAVYYNTLVIGTTGKDKSFIYGIALE